MFGFLCFVLRLFFGLRVKGLEFKVRVRIRVRVRVYVFFRFYGWGFSI